MELAVSYLFLRRAVGLIGALLPIAVPLGYSITTGHWQLLESISIYYYTDVRNVFVGSLCAVGVFLICYRYQRWDDMISTFAGVFAIGVAFCPTLPPNASDLARVLGVLHDIFAIAFFVSMAMMCIVLFTRSDVPPSERTGAKNRRNTVYVVCGVVMLVFTALAALSSLASARFVADVHPLFWCEAVGTFTFGVAWWIKGETLWRDSRRLRSEPTAQELAA